MFFIFNLFSLFNFLFFYFRRVNQERFGFFFFFWVLFVGRGIEARLSLKNMVHETAPESRRHSLIHRKDVYTGGLAFILPARLKRTINMSRSFRL